MIKVEDRLEILSEASGERETVVTIEMLKENLRLKIEDGGFTDPNTKHISLYLGDDLITSTSFSVRQTREYEG